MTSPDTYRDVPHPRPYRPPTGIPEKAERNTWRGLLGSLGLHLAFALVFLIPWVASEIISVREKRSGGPGPSGGGGGGTGGTGGAAVERLHYVPLVQPAPPPPAPVALPPQPVVPPPPPPQPTPQPQLSPPVPPPVQPPAPQAAAPVEVPAAGAVSGAATLGQGGGTGNDGTAGSGPGSGGGIGSGVGTGRGSGVGPGTGGGGPDSIYPATLVTLALPPLDAPRKLRPYTLVAYFDVDERGNTKLVGFNETPDSKFNRRVRDVLSEVRYRPAVLASGRPVRDTVRFEIDYP